eukprot:g12135.t1
MVSRAITRVCARSTRSRKWEVRVMQQLWRLLQRLPAERRRESLERLTVPQQQALECWVLANAVTAQKVCSQASYSSKLRSSRQKKPIEPAALEAGAWSRGASRNIVRYVRGQGRCYYAAQLQLGHGLRMLSKTDPSLKHIRDRGCLCGLCVFTSQRRGTFRGKLDSTHPV